MARPKKQIDPKLVESLAAVGCTNIEIATLAGCSDDTLTRRFADILERGSASLKMSLRRKQVTIAQAGNVAMLIWLGKNLLGQTDRQAIEHGGFASLYQDPLKSRNGYGRTRKSSSARVVAPGNGRTPRVPPPTAD